LAFIRYRYAMIYLRVIPTRKCPTHQSEPQVKFALDPGRYKDGAGMATRIFSRIGRADSLEKQIVQR
jgi:hypothetical protein